MAYQWKMSFDPDQAKYAQGVIFSRKIYESAHPHYVQSVRIRSFSGPSYFAFRLNTERYGVSLRIKSKCGKIRTRKTPNNDTFYVVPPLYFNNPTVELTHLGLQLDNKILFIEQISNKTSKTIKLYGFFVSCNLFYHAEAY